MTGVLFWFLLGVGLLVIISGAVKSGVSKGRAGNAAGAAVAGRVPASKLPPVDASMFTPLDRSFGDGEAADAVGKFMAHIRWAVDAEALQDERESYAAASGEHLHNLEWSIQNAESHRDYLDQLAIALRDQLEEDDLSAADKKPLRTEFKSIERKLERIDAQRAGLELELSAFKADQRGFVVGYLNHRIHRRKSPVAKLLEFE